MNICHNPACHRPIRHADAYLRSVSLVQVAFCSAACVDMFGQVRRGQSSPGAGAASAGWAGPVSASVRLGGDVYFWAA